MKKTGLILMIAAVCAACSQNVDVMIVGGGASGTAAGVQAARLGATTLIVEETPWLGGMLTGAGVSAIDGNYDLRAGFFGEFTDAVADYYGGYDSLKTGWVSNIQFEPKVAAAILDSIASAEPNLKIWKCTRFVSAAKTDKGWKVTLEKDGKELNVKAKVLIDGTELGDVASACGVSYELSPVVQDLTMVLTVKDYGTDQSIDMPEGYDPMRYANCCINPLNHPSDKNQVLWDVEHMMTYGRLPGGSVMLNWPIEGNDFYVNMVEMSREERGDAVQEAKLQALGYLYFIQNELGLRNIGIDKEQYPTEDGFPMIPYHRESRRIDGVYRYAETEALDPYSTTAFRTGIAVGNYPIDHHHYQRSDWKNLPKSYNPIPSFTVPLGVMIPREVEDLIVAEKSISVTSMMNGSTRLQPVTLELGQAAGVLAALAVQGGCKVREVPVRQVQSLLLEAGARLQPYLDLQPGERGFEALQRIGSTGILRGEGRNVGWSNQMWMRADEPLLWCDLYLDEYYGIAHNTSTDEVATAEFCEILGQISGVRPELNAAPLTAPLTRKEAAIIIDSLLNPFEKFPVSHDGKLLR